MKNISNTQNAKHSNKVTRKQKLAQGRLNWWWEPSYRHRLQMHLIQLMFGGIHLRWVVLFDFYDTLLVWLGRFSVSLVNYDQLQHSGSKEKRKWELQTFKPNLRLFRSTWKPEKSVVFSSFHCFSLWKENWLSNLNACKARVRQVPVLNLPSVKFCFNPLSFCVNQVTELEKLT